MINKEEVNKKQYIDVEVLEAWLRYENSWDEGSKSEFNKGSLRARNRLLQELEYLK